MEGDGKAGWLAGLAESLVERGFIIYRIAYTELRVFFGPEQYLKRRI